MSYRLEANFNFGAPQKSAASGGLVKVAGYERTGRPPEEIVMMEKASHYGADAVFFEAPREGKPAIAQAFIFNATANVSEDDFAECHRRLWSWGGVPLAYRVTGALVQLFRCAHRPDFECDGRIVCRPFKTLKIALQIASDPWWDTERLRNGTLWDDPTVCRSLLSSGQSAQKTLITAVKELHDDLEEKNFLTKPLRRRLLILCVLIAYLEARNVFEDDFFHRFLRNAQKFFQVLADGSALVRLLEHLEERFNGNVFTLSAEEQKVLRASSQLKRFAELVEGRTESNGQLTLWQRYSFADLPVELISHIYQLFVKDTSVAVYTPHFVVRLMLGEVLNWERLDRLEAKDEVILDGACGSGIFLVEAYKRLVLHWRHRNSWKRPNQTTLKKLLVSRLRGIDLEEGAVELAAFSLCLALCDALEPMEIRSSVKLFPPLKGKTLHACCFFEARETNAIDCAIGIIVGNPPFTSTLNTGGAQRSYERYQEANGALPDKQLAYLFLHDSMEMLARGGVMSMLQQYNFIYNQKAEGFRRRFIQQWDVREVLDFISVRGLFQKGGADTKVVVIVAEAQSPPQKRQILHATFRRSGRVDAEQGFDIDYYDMHWMPRELVLTNDRVWRTNLVGGGRVLAFVERLRKFDTLGKYAKQHEWEDGEGFIFGDAKDARPAGHVIGKRFLPEEALHESGIEKTGLSKAPDRNYQWPRRKEIYTPPVLVIRENMDLHHDLWTESYLTYSSQIFGFGLPEEHTGKAKKVSDQLRSSKKVLRAFVAASSSRLFCQRSTAISGSDVLGLPLLPKDFELSEHEEIIARDIVDYYRDIVRLGADSEAMKNTADSHNVLNDFNEVYADRISAVYRKNKLHSVRAQNWEGVICQPFVFGKAEVDWSDADDLRGKLEKLLQARQGGGIAVTRVARIYDGACIYLLKPNRLRYWLRSTALRDADETLADLSAQGF